MKLKINRDHFSKAIQQVLNIVSSRPSLPILSNVLLEAKENYLKLTTTSLDLSIVCRVEAQVELPGCVTLPVRKLNTIIHSLPSQTVSLETTPGYQAKISSGGSLFKITGMSPEEFPSLPSLPEVPSLKLKQEVLVHMLKSIVYAQSGDESRYILNGVYFNRQKDKLTLVATDGRRLAIISKDIELEEAQVGSFILPAKTVGELIRLLGKNAYLNIQYTDKQVSFSIEEESSKEGLMGSTQLISKLVDGKYPDYNQVVPKQTEHRIKIERELLLSCIQRTALVTTEKHNSIKLKFSKNLLELSASSTEYGDAQEAIAIAYEGPDLSIAFNPYYLMDPLKALTKDELFFEFKDELSPGVFKTLDQFLCVVMPLRLS